LRARAASPGSEKTASLISPPGRKPLIIGVNESEIIDRPELFPKLQSQLHHLSHFQPVNRRRFFRELGFENNSRALAF
jgi:hypothetical protein